MAVLISILTGNANIPRHFLVNLYRRKKIMPRQSIFDMKLSKIYPLLLAKVERKGRTSQELDEVITIRCSTLQVFT